MELTMSTAEKILWSRVKLLNQCFTSPSHAVKRWNEVQVTFSLCKSLR